MSGLIEQLRDETLHSAKDFRKFAIRGNVIDLAVGVVIGTAFGKIVSSLVADIIMPPLGLLIGGVKFTHMKITLKAASATSPAVTINYGNFVQTCTDFLIISLCIFVFVRVVARFNHTTLNAPPAQEVLLTEIRDLLRKIANEEPRASRPGPDGPATPPERPAP